YLSALHQQLSAKLDKKVVEIGNKLYTEIKTKSANLQQAGNMAIGYWISGQPELTLFLLSKICMEDVAQPDNLCNYAAALTMLGGEQLAIPILQNLNSKFRKNSSILNNLGQAWFGLG